jgi:hypothetical protein
MNVSKWIEIVPEGASKSGKTMVWSVYTLSTPRRLLGNIGWYAPWRRYCFGPVAQTIFEQDCLRDIAIFLETETQKQKKTA